MPPIAYLLTQCSQGPRGPPSTPPDPKNPPGGNPRSPHRHNSYCHPGRKHNRPKPSQKTITDMVPSTPGILLFSNIQFQLTATNSHHASCQCTVFLIFSCHVLLLGLHTPKSKPNSLWAKRPKIPPLLGVPGTCATIWEFTANTARFRRTALSAT